ncbi:acyl-CoA carboxylase subunit epsilon [Streptomyces sp. PTM05]|uniref:Acyl-CoA carboxylase subunit epsilon n=1 Tax=Streptantibioticus parmotrematis TaxID=2873249 RepID=A0ABS7R3E1_9ACTN|nr:acyl-CoA carboxylase subunit epsilon [Streptantibioticus parmotrematis]MBY8889414.1 acyl-CoA carboxylase subunit epsilon [Streptantibioticus parmotrematis]
MSSDTAAVVRVTRGHADAEELAAITAVLLARAAATRVADAPLAQPRDIAHWRRLERAPGFHAPHSWRAVA